jgi:hypothetical protein
MNTTSTWFLLPCLAPRASLAGRSYREAQGTAKIVGGEDPRSGTRHPPVLPVDLAPSLNWPGSNAHEELLGILLVTRVLINQALFE